MEPLDVTIDRLSAAILIQPKSEIKQAVPITLLTHEGNRRSHAPDAAIHGRTSISA
jgi:hypothetical protein